MLQQPTGAPVADTKTRDQPDRNGLKGEFVELHRIDPAAQSADLFDASHGDPQRMSVWTYMPMSGPFADRQAMQAWLERCRDRPDYIFYAVYDRSVRKYIGMTSFINIVPEMQRLEVGFIWYTPPAQRGKVNTESIYLMLCEAFDRRRYRRVEWKCDCLNQPSRDAALRLGFQYEGLFLQHMIVNGKNRDTAWFAMLDGDWPRIKSNIQRWLSNSGGYFSLREANAK